MPDWIIDLIMNAATSIMLSVFLVIFSYYKFLRKIPQETKQEIDQLLNDRLGYETSNHNSIMEALNPNTQVLSSDHREIRAQLTNINANVEVIKKQKDVDYRLLNNSERQIVHSIDTLADFSVLFVRLQKDLDKMRKDNIEQQQVIASQRKEIRKLKNALKASHEARFPQNAAVDSDEDEEWEP